MAAGNLGWPSLALRHPRGDGRRPRSPADPSVRLLEHTCSHQLATMPERYLAAPYLQAPHFPPPFLQNPHDLQFLQALQGLAPTHVATPFSPTQQAETFDVCRRTIPVTNAADTSRARKIFILTSPRRQTGDRFWTLESLSLTGISGKLTAKELPGSIRHPLRPSTPPSRPDLMPLQRRNVAEVRPNISRRDALSRGSSVPATQRVGGRSITLACDSQRLLRNCVRTRLPCAAPRGN